MRHTGRKGEEERRAGESVLLVTDPSQTPATQANSKGEQRSEGATRFVGSPFVVIMDLKIPINCDI